MINIIYIQTKKRWSKIMNKFVIGTVALIVSLSSLASCGRGEKLSAEEEAFQKEISQNDYRGGIIRTKALQSIVLETMENMKQNNLAIRTDNPNSFWTQDGYQDFVVNFLNADIINDTQWFSEEEYEWDEVMDNISNEENNFTQLDGDKYVLKDNVTITRNEKDDYSISCTGSMQYDNTDFDGVFNYHVLYDCDKDWCKAYAETNLNAGIPSITPALYEYARIDKNTFAVQTSKERLVVVFEDATEDTQLNERKLKEFYYSKLTNNGERTEFTPYIPKEEYPDGDYYNEENVETNSVMSSYPFINEHGDIYNLYGKSDSMFLTEDIIEGVNGEWAFEDKSLQQAIVYKDGALVVITYNKLSENYERFIYTLDGVPESTITEIESMVEIKDLVGTHKNENEGTILTSATEEDSSSSESEMNPYGNNDGVDDGDEEGYGGWSGVVTDGTSVEESADTSMEAGEVAGADNSQAEVSSTESLSETMTTTTAIPERPVETTTNATEAPKETTAPEVTTAESQ